MAGAVGFEPTNADSKNRCLTAWRRPNRLFDIQKPCILVKYPVCHSNTSLNRIREKVCQSDSRMIQLSKGIYIYFGQTI